MSFPFWVISQPNVDGFCFNMGHCKALIGVYSPNMPDISIFFRFKQGKSIPSGPTVRIKA